MRFSFSWQASRTDECIEQWHDCYWKQSFCSSKLCQPALQLADQPAKRKLCQYSFQQVFVFCTSFIFWFNCNWFKLWCAWFWILLSFFSYFAHCGIFGEFENVLQRQIVTHFYYAPNFLYCHFATFFTEILLLLALLLILSIQ